MPSRKESDYVKSPLHSSINSVTFFPAVVLPLTQLRPATVVGTAVIYPPIVTLFNAGAGATALEQVPRHTMHTVSPHTTVDYGPRFTSFNVMDAGSTVAAVRLDPLDL